MPTFTETEHYALNVIGSSVATIIASSLRPPSVANATQCRLWAEQLRNPHLPAVKTAGGFNAHEEAHKLADVLESMNLGEAYERAEHLRASSEILLGNPGPDPTPYEG